MTYLRRYPDKPFERPASSLSEFDTKAGKWIATAKYDGWRCLIVIDNGVEFWSRHMKKLPVSDRLREAVQSLNLPQGTVIDAEWMARRAGVKDELIFLITIMWWAGAWQGGKPEEVRWQETKNILVGKGTDFPIRLPLYATEKFSEFFERTKNDPTTEGIVLKEVTSTLVGDNSDSKKNGCWVKVKWRAGDDGKTIIA